MTELRVNDVTIGQNEITILYINRGKGHKRPGRLAQTRTAVLQGHNRLMEGILEGKNLNDELFPFFNGDTANRHIQKAAALQGWAPPFEQYVLHGLRHGRAHDLRDAGLSAEDVMSVCGWKSRTTLGVYAHESAASLNGRKVMGVQQMLAAPATTSIVIPPPVRPAPQRLQEGPREDVSEPNPLYHAFDPYFDIDSDPSTDTEGWDQKRIQNRLYHQDRHPNGTPMPQSWWAKKKAAKERQRKQRYEAEAAIRAGHRLPYRGCYITAWGGGQQTEGVTRIPGIWSGLADLPEADQQAIMYALADPDRREAMFRRAERITKGE